MMTALTPPLKWHGGKHYLARRIVGLMPPHLNYVEPYAGVLAVLLARDPDDERLWLPPHKGVSELANDLNRALVNFWLCLQYEDTFAKMRRFLDAVPFSGPHWELSRDVLKAAADRLRLDLDDVFMGNWVEACHFFIFCRQSLAGRMKGFSGVTRTRLRSRMNNEVSAWLNCIDGLPEVHARLKRVLILPPQPALRVIEQYNVPETLFYLDPPYLHRTRIAKKVYGDFEMTEADHRELLDALRRCRGKVMLSGYPDALYDAALAGWNRHAFDLPNNAAGGKTKDRETEVLWCNF
jgi:DNA adenine methylase